MQFLLNAMEKKNTITGSFHTHGLPDFHHPMENSRCGNAPLLLIPHRPKNDLFAGARESGQRFI